MPQISIVIPAYNEEKTIVQVIEKLHAVLQDYSLEILVVNDGSTDGTSEEIRKIESNEHLRIYMHSSNRGKGASLRTAFAEVQGQVVVIQDADLEYDPNDIPQLIKPILDGDADVAFGSRFQSQSQSAHLLWHCLANKFLTRLSNLHTSLTLSDMETGYKAFSVELARKLCIREDRFGVEPELTAKVARLGCRICEVPISYRARNYSDGKKIRVRDAIRAVWCIFRYRFLD